MNRDPIAEAGHSRGPGSARALGFVLVLSLVAGALVFLLMVREDREPRWDEASHGLQGVLVAHDVRPVTMGRRNGLSCKNAVQSILSATIEAEAGASSSPAHRMG